MKKKLERLMYMGLGAVIALGGYFFGTFHNDQVDAQVAPANVEYNEVSCRSLNVVDEDGKPRIVLGARTNAAIISILDGNRKPRINFLMVDTDNSGEISITDENGKSRINLKTLADGNAIIAVSDENGKPRVALSTPDEEGLIGIVDENGKPRVDLRTLDGKGVISITDENGIPRLLD